LVGSSDLRKRHVENCHVPSFASPKATETSQPFQNTEPMIADSPSTSAWLDMLMAPPTNSVPDVPALVREAVQGHPKQPSPMQVSFAFISGLPINHW
jgi:hypothetical protein